MSQIFTTTCTGNFTGHKPASLESCTYPDLISNTGMQFRGASRNCREVLSDQRLTDIIGTATWYLERLFLVLTFYSAAHTTCFPGRHSTPSRQGGAVCRLDMGAPAHRTELRVHPSLPRCSESLTPTLPLLDMSAQAYTCPPSPSLCTR